MHSFKGYHHHHQLMLASIGLNVVFMLFFLADFKSPPNSPLQTLSQASSGGSPSTIQSCSLRDTDHFPDSTLHRALDITTTSNDQPVNLDHGDPTMFEAYWLGNGDSCAMVILGWEHMSYFASRKHFIWFVEQELENQIRRLHSLVGNAVTKGKSIVVGTGSTQLFQAALYAVSPRDEPSPAQVVSATPYYSSYPVLTDYLKSGIYQWAGDAAKFKPGNSSSYIELVTSPNNPDGTMRLPVVKGGGPVIYDLAYYWPHYTPITAEVDHDIMLFTVSKSTGHAGSRIGWAIVRDPKVAETMTKFIELNTIGVSHDSQLRAAQILKSIVRGYTTDVSAVSRPFELADRDQDHYMRESQLFHFGYKEMSRRWGLLRKAVSDSNRFSLPEFAPSLCSFFGQITTPHPAFAWLKCNQEADCKEVLKLGGILSRCGSQFGAGPEYVRISMLDRGHNFETFLSRLSSMVSLKAAIKSNSCSSSARVRIRSDGESRSFCVKARQVAFICKTQKLHMYSALQTGVPFHFGTWPSSFIYRPQKIKSP